MANSWFSTRLSSLHHCCTSLLRLRSLYLVGAAGGVVVKGSAQDQKVASSSPTSGRVSEVRPFFVFVFTNSYVSLPFSHTQDKPEKLYNAGFGQANAEF